MPGLVRAWGLAGAGVDPGSDSGSGTPGPHHPPGQPVLTAIWGAISAKFGFGGIIAVKKGLIYWARYPETGVLAVFATK